MRIGIYVDVAKVDQPTGIGLHVRNLVNALAQIDDRNEYLLYYQSNLFGNGKPFPCLPNKPNFRARPIRFPVHWVTNHPSLWWKWYLPRVLRKDSVDVFHGPNHFAPSFDPEKSIVTIHDLAYFRMQVHEAGENAMLQTWTKHALQWANTVIALSENSKRDVEELGVAPARIRVIYGGGHVVPEDQIQYSRTEELKKSLKLPDKYILFVGSLQPRKNVPFLLRSFARLKKEMTLPHRLVLAGHRDTAASEIDRLVQELGIAADVLITGYVDASQLPLLYKMADLFVLPTLYEGFTLVTLEAMAYGVPVIATDTSSIREGVGEAALLVEPDDIEALACAMRSVLTQGDLHQRLIERGRDQARKFNWDQCARETLALYREVHERAIRGNLVLAQ